MKPATLTRRDDFSSETKELLAHRVGMRCANPNCRQPTSGPQDCSTESLNIGVAAHITAASKGGPRYNSSLTSDERKSPDNGIWLCQNCGKLVDNDELRFTEDLLRKWKQLSEESARLAIESPRINTEQILGDTDLVRFFAQCFDRPAFQDRFRQEGSTEAFDKAIEDTIIAINTGCLRSRDGTVLFRAKGKAFITNSKWRERLDVIVDLLRAIRSRYASAIALKQIHVDARDQGNTFYCVNDPLLAQWMDSTRYQVLQIFTEIANQAGVTAPSFPRMHPTDW